MPPKIKPWRAHPLSGDRAPVNAVLRAALGGDEHERRVPSLAELLRPSRGLALRPGAVGPSGWCVYHVKLVEA